jgi:hypothetical protein
MPRDPRRDKMLETIQRALDAVAMLNPFARLFGESPFDFLGGFAEEDDDDYDDDW